MGLKNNKIYKSEINKPLSLGLYPSSISAGFPSPAEDHLDIGLDLNEYLVKHPSSTFYIYVKGNSMINSGIYDGDLMIVDRSLQAASNSIVVAVVDGDFTVKRISKKGDDIYLMPDNKNYKPICINNTDSLIWGVVTHTIHHF